ncbi:MAG TPA: type VI secretion system tip protein TssI/VgrG [Caulifigura sp.]|jgi:type VI secretion system secreted protein VgrG|nr:type VI secretion system tip protein TssI/VgrG [Caulifigura sp.]
MPDYTDKQRLLLFKADGKTDLLLPTSFTASERMSGLFHVHVELLVPVDKASQVKVDQFLGKRMTLRVALDEDYTKGPYRYFDGVCNRFAAVGKDHRFHYFEADLVPWLWLLEKKEDLRVFQDQNVPDIVETILKELQGDFGEFQFEIRAQRGNYKKFDYCVQFKETHFNFISRLLEDEGIYYYFEHTESGHKLIIDDSLTAGKDVPNQAQVSLKVESGPDESGKDAVLDWREERVIHSGKFAARDYHSQLAQNKIDYSDIASKTVMAKNDKLEVFEWPSGGAVRYNLPDQRLGEVNSNGSRLVNLRAQESETGHHTFSGMSRCRGFVAGYQFTLKHEPGKKYLLTSIQHSAVQDGSYITGDSYPTPYSNTFVAIPADIQYRPERKTEKPLVEGLQSAKVVGKSGDEIYVDKYGRVRVQFYWDRKGKHDEKSACWVRVAQIAAGKRWGASFWPRIGQEVMVAFVEGDPDQPVIVGTVYNNQQMPPYLGDGPDDKHKVDPNVSGIKTNSTKGGDGYNELRFDDTKDKEQVFIHAEKDMDVRVKNDSREQTMGERHLIVGDEKGGDNGGYFFQCVHKHWTALTRRSKKEKIENNSYITVGNGSEGGEGNLHQYVEKDVKDHVGGDHHINVKGNRNEVVGGTQSLDLGSLQAKIGQGMSLEAGTTLHMKAMTIVLEADLQLSLKVGGNFVDISVAGVAINGMPMTLINSGGAPGAVIPPQLTAPTAPEYAATDKPPLDWFHKADNSKTGSKSCD